MIKTASILIAASALLAGCGGTFQKIKVPLPVACQEAVPARPVMPTESLLPGVDPYVLHRAALAEIDRREGYEIKLLAALVACTAPL